MRQKPGCKRPSRTEEQTAGRTCLLCLQQLMNEHSDGHLGRGPIWCRQLQTMALKTLEKFRCHELEICFPSCYLQYEAHFLGVREASTGVRGSISGQPANKVSSMADKPLPSDLPLAVTKDLHLKSV